MIILQFYNDPENTDRDYCTGKEDIYKVIPLKDGAEVRTRWDELLEEYEGEIYSSWHDGKLTSWGAFDPDDVDRVADDGMERWHIEYLIRKMKEMKPGETITLAGWYDAVDGDCYCARVIQRVDASAWGWITGQVGMWLIGRYQYAEPMTVITDLDEDYLEEDVKAYLTENELFEDGEMVYVRV